MADVHEEKALLSLCRAPGLRSATPSRAHGPRPGARSVNYTPEAFPGAASCALRVHTRVLPGRTVMLDPALPDSHAVAIFVPPPVFTCRPAFRR